MHGSEELKQKYMSRNASEPIVSAYCVTVGLILVFFVDLSSSC